MRHLHLHLFLALTIGSQTCPALAKPIAKPKAKPASKPKPSAVEERAAELAFKAGADFLGQEKYPEALAQFQRALKVFPNDPDILWNAGTAAFSSQQYKLAANYFERDVKHEPLNGHLYARLVQTYQALGDFPRRDAHRAKVLAMHRSGKDESGYTKKDSYCRDQFTIKGYHVYAMESFELRPRNKKDNLFGVRYEFLVALPNTQTPAMRLEVGWNSLKPDGKGGFIPADERSAFYFDAYYAEGEYWRKTFGLFRKELPYDASKQMLINIMNDRVEMISGQTRESNG